MRRESLIIGLDIGTTKICCLVGEVEEDGVLNVIGVGRAPSRGLHKGVVVDIESTTHAIREAVEQAEVMSGREIDEVYIGISGAHIRGQTSRGMIVIKGNEITEHDIARVVEAAQAIAIPPDREVVHILPQEFIVDDQNRIREPIGMSGRRLEARVYIVTAQVTSAENLIKCANRTGLEVADMVLQQLASAEAVLMPDERELGVALVDIGGGTTDIALFTEGSLKHTAVIPVGGKQFDNDLAVGLRTPIRQAEKIKRHWGVAQRALAGDEELVEVPAVGGRSTHKVPRRQVAEILEPRAEELIELVGEQLQRSGLVEQLAGGVVFTGGGAQLPGLVELAEERLGMPCRLGLPRNIQGLADIVSSPQYATGVGLMLYGLKYNSEHFRRKRGRHGLLDRVRARMRSWFGELAAAMF